MDDETRAYIANAVHHTQELLDTVVEGLTSYSDRHVKLALLDDIEAVATNLRKALS